MMATTSSAGVCRCTARTPFMLAKPSLYVAKRAVLSRSAKETGPSTEEKASTSSTSVDDDVEAFENRMKGRKRAGKVEAKVQVSAPAVDLATGKMAPTPENEFEGRALLVLLFLFSIIMLEGLMLAAAGFLPEDQDLFITKVIYPAFSPSVVVFLLASSLYGLWKTGKLPGQRQL